jgi:hypothetical protein
VPDFTTARVVTAKSLFAVSATVAIFTALSALNWRVYNHCAGPAKNINPLAQAALTMPGGNNAIANVKNKK